MARRKAKVDLTLFPFMSVLAGLIAVMVLFMIVTISTRVISAEAALLPERKSTPGGDRPGASIPHGIDAATYDKLERQLAALEKQLVEKQAAVEKVRGDIAAMKAVVRTMELEKDRVTGEPRKGTRLGEPPKVKMIPGQGVGVPQKKPVFIEINSSGYIVHPEKTRFDPIVLKKTGGREELAVPPELATYLEGLARDGEARYALMLIRPDGTEAFVYLRAHLVRLKERFPDLDMGWEPFASEWLLDN